MEKKVATWHPPTVKPQDGEYIIVNVVSNVCFLTVFQNGKYAPSEGFRPPFETVKRWAYIDDILPDDDK